VLALTFFNWCVWESGAYSFTQQIFIEYLPCMKHCRPGNTALNRSACTHTCTWWKLHFNEWENINVEIIFCQFVHYWICLWNFLKYRSFEGVVWFFCLFSCKYLRFWYYKMSVYKNSRTTLRLNGSAAFWIKNIQVGLSILFYCFYPDLHFFTSLFFLFLDLKISLFSSDFYSLFLNIFPPSRHFSSTVLVCFLLF
jgi:hypothetical protein